MVNSDVNLNGVDDRLLTAVTNIADYYEFTITISSGKRSKADQQVLWDASVANGTPGFLPNGNPVARPGTSAHESGNAIDILKNVSVDAEFWCERFGVNVLVEEDCYHLTLK